MTPLDQIKKLAGNFIFNQVLCPRDSFFLSEVIPQEESVDVFLQMLYGQEKEKIDFALSWCAHQEGSVLDLSNNQGRLALSLVQNQISTSVIENSQSKITELRKLRSQLAQAPQSLFSLYPFETTKFEIDESFSTLFVAPQVMEQTETELMILGTLRKCLSHLNPEGSCFIEVHNLDYFETQWDFRDSIWRYALPDSPSNFQGRLWERTYPGPKESQTLFEYAVSQQLNEFELYRSTLHLFNLDQWMKLFEVAGFIVEECYGDWKKNVPNSQSPLLIFHLKVK